MAALTLRTVVSTAVSKTATGSLGSAVITVSPDVFGIVVGHIVEGTGIATGATVLSVSPADNQVTLSAVNTGAVSGTIAFKEFTKNSPLTNQQIDDNFVEIRRDLTTRAPLDYASLTNVTISSGSINNTTIGASTRSSGAFTTLTANGATTLTANVASTTTGTGTLVVTGGVGVSGRVTADNFVGTGSGLTSLTAGNLSGTIPTGVLGNSSLFVGTTSIALNRASANLALTGISSVALPGATAGTVTLQPAATAGTTTITLPATTGTVITTGNTSTVTNTMLAGSIANAKLANSSVTVNGTAISLGGTGTITANTTNALTIGTGLSGTSFNGSSAVTIAVDSTIARRADTTFIGTTSVALNRTSANLALTGISSVQLPGATSGTVTLQPAATAGTTTITLPATSGTVYVSGGTDIPLADGGTNASLTATAGGIVYSTASALAISAAGSAGQVLTSDGAGAPTWSSISFSGATSLPVENSAGTVQFTSTDSTGIQFAASGATSVAFDAVNQRVTFSSTDNNWYPTTFAWTDGSTAGPTGSLTGSGMSAVSYAAIPSASQTTSGVVTTAAQTIAGAKTFRASATQDAVTIQGRAGGTGSFAATITPTALTASRTITLPDISGTVITTGDTGTVTSTMIANDTIVDGDINASAAIAITKLAASTISGISLGNNLNAVTFNNGGSGDTSGTTYNGSTARTISYNSLGAAGISAANTFANASGQAFVQTAAQDGIIINGRAGGTTNLRVTVVPGTLTASRTLTLPDVTGTVITTGDTSTVTNTMLAGSIANAKLANSSVTVNGTAIALGGSATVTANTTNTLTIGNGLSGTSFNGSSAVTIAVSAAEDSTNATYYPVFATSQGTAVVLGTRSTYTFNPSTGTLYAANLNTSSDATLKENIQEIDGLALVEQLRPVSFTWKDTGRQSYGVIAQEIEKVLPELVDAQDNGIKSVSYLPLIALLIDAVKTLDARVKQLESK